MASNYSLDTAAYLINGKNIKTYFGARVVATNGFTSLPARKVLLQNNWPDENGLEVDLSANYYEARNLSMEIKIFADSLQLMNDYVRSFMAEFQKPGLQYVKLVGNSKLFLVYCQDAILPVRKTAIYSTKHYSELTIPLIEPYPIVRQFTVNATGSLLVTLVVVATKANTVDWGDGTFSALAGSGTVTHTYAIGVYCISLYGGAEGITSVTPTNCTAI